MPPSATDMLPVANMTSSANLTNASTTDSNLTIIAKSPVIQFELVPFGISSIGCVILVFNVFVLVFLARFRGQIGTGAMKSQLMSITLSDILTSLSVASFGLTNTQLFSCNRIACAMIPMSFYVVQTASILTMSFVGSQRLVTVLNIKKQQRDLTNRGTRVVQVTVPVIWTLSVLLYVGLYAVYAESDTAIPTCRCVAKEVFGENHKTFINNVVYINVASLLVVNGIYITMFIKLRLLYPSSVERKRLCCMPCSNTENSDTCNDVDVDLPKKFSTQKTSSDMKTGGPGSKHAIWTSSESATGQSSSSDLSLVESDLGQNDKSKQTTSTTITRKSQMNNVQALVTVGLLLVALNVSTAPFVILRVMRNLASIQVSVSIANSVNACMALNALLDPFVYCWRIKQVRQSLKTALASLFCPKVCCRR